VKPEAGDWIGVPEALKALRQELAVLSERVSALEVRIAGSAGDSPSTTHHSPPTTHHPAPTPAEEESLSEELIIVIGAAIAAYLGKKPRIRQIRLLGGPAWAQQGRVTIQASHALATRHTRGEH
jgi:methylmalonyl-CoA carboxyltransferase large subunit